MAKAQIILAVNGNKQLTDLLSSESFDVDKKLEYEFSEFKASDGVISLPISKLIPISKIIASSSGPLTLKTLTDLGEQTTQISGIYYSTMDPYSASNISGLSIETNNTQGGINGYISVIKLV